MFEKSIYLKLLDKIRERKNHLIVAYMNQGWKLQDKEEFAKICLEKYYLKHDNGNKMVIVVDSSLGSIDVLINNRLKDNIQI